MRSARTGRALDRDGLAKDHKSSFTKTLYRARAFLRRLSLARVLPRAFWVGMHGLTPELQALNLVCCQDGHEIADYRAREHRTSSHPRRCTPYVSG